MTIYERIKFLRKSRGMSQEELARKVGYEGRAAISKVENGDRDINQSMIKKYADALNVTPSYLLYGDTMSAGNISGWDWSKAFCERLSGEITGVEYADSEAASVDLDRLSRIASGEITITLSEACNIADELGLSLDEMVGLKEDEKELSTNYSGYDNIFPITQKKIPLLGEIACGQPIFCDKQRESYVVSGINVQADFCLKAKGDSMTGARILDGDIVFIKSQDMVDNGQIAAVIIDNEATLKRVYYYPEKQKLMLVPENPAYEPLMYIGEELEDVRILGLAVAFQSDVR